MNFLLGYNDLRKLATIFRKPGLVLCGCGLSPERLLQVEVRIDLAAFVDIAAKLNRPVPITIQVDLNINLLDSKTISLQLSSLQLDKSELPIVIRPLLRPKQLRKKLFAAIPETPGITVDAKSEQVAVALGALAIDHPLLNAACLKRLVITDQGISLELNFASSEVR